MLVKMQFQDDGSQKNDMNIDEICLTQEFDDETDEEDPTDLGIDKCMMMISSDLSSPKN